MTSEGGEKRKRMIVLLPLPVQSHINPMLRLGSILHANGFQITVVHPQFNAPNPSSNPHFTFLPLTDGINLTNYNSLFRYLSDLNKECMPQLLHCLTQLIQAAADDNGTVACIIYDNMFFDVEATAEKIGIPSLVLRIGSATYSLVQTKLTELISHGHQISTIPEEQIVTDLHPLRPNDLHILAKPNPEEALQIHSKMSKITTAKAIIFDTVQCLEQFSIEKLGQNYIHVPIFTAGPFHKLTVPVSVPEGGGGLWRENRGCLNWLDKQKTPNSVVYVSIGSVIKIYLKEFVEMAHALANCEQPFLWVVRPGSIIDGSSDVKEYLPEKFNKLVAEEKGFMVEWCPQIECLSHRAVGGFMTQCGWNSILEGICEGVPLICRPELGDQVMTTRYVCHEWRIGVELKRNPQLERGEMEKVIRKVMASEEGEEMRKRAANLRSKLEAAIAEGGSSSNALDALLHLISSFD